MKKIFKTVLIFFSIFNLQIFADKPSSNEILDYYIACAKGNVKIVETFLKKNPSCADIELDNENPFGIELNYAYRQFASWLASEKNISFENKEEEEKWLLDYKRYPINIASFYGYTEIVKLLIKYQSNYRIKRRSWKNSFIRLCRSGAFSLVNELLKANANINTVSSNGMTPLMTASCGGYKDIVKLLLEKGASVNQQDSDGLTVLMYASHCGHKDIVKLLLEKRASVNQQDSSGSTALMYASSNGHKDIVKLLLKNRADINYLDSNGQSILHVAAYKGHADVVNELLKNKIDIKHTDKEGFSALHMAAQNGHLETVELLLKNGADIEGKTLKDGCTPLSLASAYGKINIVKTFIIAGADINYINNNSYSVLGLACEGGHKEVVSLLMDYRADLMNSNMTVLLHDVYIASLMKKHSDVACMILSNPNYYRAISPVINATFSINSGISMSIFMYSAQQGYRDLLKLLINKEINVNQANETGMTALMFACGNGHIDIVEDLIKAGADVNAKTTEGLQAIHFAAYNHDDKILYRLILAGAEVPNLKN